jgi:hypothetical protein
LAEKYVRTFAKTQMLVKEGRFRLAI